MRIIGTFDGAQVEIDYREQPVLVIRCLMNSVLCDYLVISGLVQMLGGLGLVHRNGQEMRAEIPYDGALDERIVALIDLLCDLRYAHPTMVQLPLALNEVEAREMAEVLGG